VMGSPGPSILHRYTKPPPSHVRHPWPTGSTLRFSFSPSSIGLSLSLISLLSGTGPFPFCFDSPLWSYDPRTVDFPPSNFFAYRFFTLYFFFRVDIFKKGTGSFSPPRPTAAFFPPCQNAQSRYFFPPFQLFVGPLHPWRGSPSRSATPPLYYSASSVLTPTTLSLPFNFLH